jgi:hypothetical protein
LIVFLSPVKRFVVDDMRHKPIETIILGLFQTV